MQKNIIHNKLLTSNSKLLTLKAFTLVELIIVITILSILATIGFVSYNGYIISVRDTNRISQLAAIHDGLEVYRTKNDLPSPENSVEVRSGTNVIGYQGYIGKNTLETIAYNKGGIDPKDQTYFSYYITKDRKYFQLMAFLEDESNKQIVKNNPLLPTTYAVDYTTRYPAVFGKKLGILTDTTNTPIQEIASIKTAGYVDLTVDTGTYKANFTDRDTLTASGYAIQSMMISRQASLAPTSCPDGFIPVPGNIEFNQNGFCVAKYEMTYSDATTPDSTGGGTDWNTMHYITNKPILSTVGKYPIADITQQQAIDACKSMGEGYHLITNNEWMTIARNIEANPDNWSSKQIGVGNLYNGVSNNTTYGCNATGGNTETRTYATKTGPGTDTNCNYRRKQTLTNGQEIYDLAGNVWEHVNKANTIDGLNYNNGQTTVTGASTGTNWDDNGIYTQTDMKKYGSSLYLGTTNGMGNLYYSNGVASNIFVRGANVHNGTHAGVFALFLDRTSGNQDRGVGFRCAK